MNDSPDGTSTHPFKDRAPAPGMPSGGGFLSPGDLVAGRYEVREILGVGGFAVVYRCVDRELRREVALKLLTRVSEEAAARLRREVALGSGWEHPNLLRLYDFGMHQGQPFCTMPMAEGGTLARRLERQGAIPFSEALPLIEQLLEGLAYLHAKGFVHRDVKPSNVFFDADGKLRLGDFGIVLDPSATRYTLQGQTPGTPFYMAPEFLTGSEPKASADIWSAGLAIKDMLRGPDATKTLPDLPKWFSRWQEGMGQQDPTRRFQSAGEALEALRKRLPPPHVRRRRRIAVALAASALAVTAIFGFAGFRVWQKSRSAATLAFEGRTLRGLANNGTPLWSLEMPAPVVQIIPISGPSPDTSRFLVTCGGNTGLNTPQPTRPLCALVSPQGKILHQEEPLARFNPFRADFPNARYAIQCLATKDMDLDGYDDVILKCIQSMYPCIVYVISGKDGRCTGGLANSGHIYAVVPIPKTRLDRQPGDFFVLGINNPMGHQAALAAGSAGNYVVSPDQLREGPYYDFPAYRLLGHWTNVDRFSSSLDAAGNLVVRWPTNELRMTPSGNLSTDPGFGDAEAEARYGMRIVSFYRSVLRVRPFVRGGQAEQGQDLYLNLIREAPDGFLAFYARIDGARALREAGRPDLALPLMPENPDGCPNPGSAMYQKGDLLTLLGRYPEARGLYERSVREPGINLWYGLPGFLQASVLQGLTPEEIHGNVLRSYPEQLNHPMVKAWALVAGYLLSGPGEAFRAVSRLNFQDSAKPSDTLAIILPQVAEIWTSYVELAAGMDPSSWPDEKAVALENDVNLSRQFEFLKAFRAHLGHSEGSLEALARSFEELQEASKREVTCLVPYTLAAYTYGFAAIESGDKKAGAEALTEGLRLYPRGPMAQRAKKALR